MPEEVYQPLGLQYNCALVPYNQTQVMKKLQHYMKLVIIVYVAQFFSIDLKLLHIGVTNILSYQTFNHLLKIQPPTNQSRSTLIKT